MNSPSFSTATSLFLNNGMTIYAPDGWYSDGSIVRQLISGVLQPPTACENCDSIECIGQYNFDYEQVVGTPQGVNRVKFTSNNSGAVIIKVRVTTSDAVGVRAIYNGQTYNKFSYNDGANAYNGYLAQPSPTDPTWIGSENCCSIPFTGCGNPDPLVQALTKIYQYNGSLSQFIDTGSTTTMVVNSSQLALRPTLFNDWCWLVLPKPPIAGAPTDFDLEIWTVGACLPAWEVEVYCPSTLLSARRTSVSTTEVIACGKNPNIPFWYASVSGNQPNLGLNDWVFDNSYGGTVLPDGYYRATNVVVPPPDTGWFKVENGRVVEIDTCP